MALPQFSSCLQKNCWKGESPMKNQIKLYMTAKHSQTYEFISWQEEKLWAIFLF
jgi:hypothetical protein